MRDYSKGKIYRLVCNKTGKQYVGSTINTLYQRLGSHKTGFKDWKDGKATAKCTSVEIVEGGDYDVVLIENYPCADKNELHARERYWIERLDCVNKVIPTRTRREYYEADVEKWKQYKKEYGREYYATNQNRIKERQREYYEKNIEHKKEYDKLYRETHKEKKVEQDRKWIEENRERKAENDRKYQQEHKEKIAQYQKQYRLDNLEKLKARKSEKVKCECGDEISRSTLPRHRKTKKHQDWLASQSSSETTSSSN
jgi:hypothetical protein